MLFLARKESKREGDLHRAEEREMLTASPAVFKGEKAQSCGSGTELHMAGSGCWDQSCQSKSLAGDTLAAKGIPWYTEALSEGFSVALINIRRRGEGVSEL